MFGGGGDLGGLCTNVTNPCVSPPGKDRRNAPLKDVPSSTKWLSKHVHG